MHLPEISEDSSYFIRLSELFARIQVTAQGE
jgi:hypothetical protein